jgi:hypothetical protein
MKKTVDSRKKYSKVTSQTESKTNLKYKKNMKTAENTMIREAQELREAVEARQAAFDQVIGGLHETLGLSSRKDLIRALRVIEKAEVKDETETGKTKGK